MDSKKGEKLPHPFLGMGETNSYLDTPPPFFFSGAAIPCFFEPSQFVSWSAQPLEPIRETLLSALHDIVSTAERKERDRVE